jgi:hypothetical protein
MKNRLLWGSAVLLTALLLTPCLAHAYLINKDVRQAFVTPQDNFEICFKGNYLNVPVNRGIIAPPGWNKNVQKSYNPATNETCFSFSGPPLAQQPRGRTYHFGIGLGTSVKKAKESNEYWTRSTAPSYTAGGSCGFSYDAATATLTAVLSNDTDAPQVFRQVGYRILDSEPALSSLNRTEMPPSSFIPSGIPDGTVLLPGDEMTFTVAGVAPTQSFVCNFTAALQNPPPGGYDDVVILWIDEVVGAPDSTVAP